MMENLSDPDNTKDAQNKAREEKLKARKEEIERQKKEKKEREEAQQARYYPKQRKVQQLEDYFEQQALFLSEEEKRVFQSFIPRIVIMLKKDKNAEKMGDIKCEEDLQRFVKNWYTRLDIADANENQCVNDWLAKYERQTLNALRQNAKIPSVTASSNTFVTLKEEALHKANRKIQPDEVARKLKIEAEKKRVVTEVTEQAVKSLHMHGMQSENIKELEKTSLDCLEEQVPRSEPLQRCFTTRFRKAALVGLEDLFVRMDLSEKNREKEMDPFLTNIFAITPVDYDNVGITPTNASNGQDVLKEEISDREELSDEEGELAEIKVDPEFALSSSSIATPVNRENTVNFKKATKTQQEEHERRKHQNPHEIRKVKFVDYNSSKNTMRVFVKPHGYICDNADDGPTTDYLDLSLSSGSKVMQKSTPPHIAYIDHRPHQFKPIYNGRVKLARYDKMAWLRGFKGNLVGRFWFINKRLSDIKIEGEFAIKAEELRCNHGLFHDYSENDLKELYSCQLRTVYKHLRRGISRRNMPSSKFKGRTNGSDPVKGVLLLTDWRLLFLDKQACLNACVKFMPTNIGEPFFVSMTEYLIELINDPNIEIHSIIFAFGGSPLFDKQSFKRFWQQLVQETLKSIDVIWTAQDWCDGLDCTQTQRDQLDTFNDYVESVFKIMNETGHRNYKYCNIRKQYDLPMMKQNFLLKNDEPDVSCLQDLYFSYIDFFANNCDFYCGGAYFVHNKREVCDYKENNGIFPRESDVHPEGS